MYYVDINRPMKERMVFESQKEIAKQLGLTEQTLSRILNGKQSTKKLTALCIVKLYDSEAEIEDYFVKKVR